MLSVIQILFLVLNVIWWIVIAHIIMSWLINFEVLNLRQPLVWQIWNGLSRLLQPVYVQIRRVLPPMGGMDFSPMVLLFGLFALIVLISVIALIALIALIFLI